MIRKAFIAGIAMVLGIYLLGLITPWWTAVCWVILISFVARLKNLYGAMAGGLSFALVWTEMALYNFINDDADIIPKTGSLMGGISPQILLLIVILISFITGALSGWFGSSFAGLIWKKERQ